MSSPRQQRRGREIFSKKEGRRGGRREGEIDTAREWESFAYETLRKKRLKSARKNLQPSHFLIGRGQRDLGRQCTAALSRRGLVLWIRIGIIEPY